MGQEPEHVLTAPGIIGEDRVEPPDLPRVGLDVEVGERDEVEVGFVRERLLPQRLVARGQHRVDAPALRHRPTPQPSTA